MGKKIENYILQNIIGEGQFGKVFRAINQKTGQTVAIKIIPIQKFKNSPRLEQFTINQIQTLSKIQDNTHVVRFIQILKTANNYYFVYQYCNGGTLEQLIKMQGHFSQQKAIKFFQDLLKAFQILCKSNIMHRDIKPSNILIHNGIIKLADFGFCKPLKDSRDLSKTMLGSPIYMAPQILKGQTYTMKADIWSLGVVLYQMIYGFCPFEEKTIAKLISAIDEHPLVMPLNIKLSNSCEDLLRRMLVKDQKLRISWQQLFNYDFKGIQIQKNMMNPFSKKGTITCIIPQQIRNRYSSNTENNIKVSQNTKILQNKDQNINRYSQNIISKSDKAKIDNAFLKNKKQRSQSPINTTSETYKKQKLPINQTDQQIIYTALDLRNKITYGLNLLKQLLSGETTKTIATISNLLCKKIKIFSNQIGDLLKSKYQAKQNVSNQNKKLIAILNQQRTKIQQKIIFFQLQNDNKDPANILLIKLAEEQSLTHQKQGLTILVGLCDYLNQCRTLDYSRCNKKQLLQIYQSRILKKY